MRIKRIVDIVASLTLLTFAAPLMALVAIAIKLTSPGPIFYNQTRLTEGGREFTLHKFRSMRIDAEGDSGAKLAKRADPRTTNIGRWLRLTRVDELPQLINVLVGDMSLIGPRPERPEIASELRRSIPSFNRRLATKAGLTGLAQVIQGYPDGIDGYRRKVGLDIVYIKNWSLLLDLWIAARTVLVVFSGSGAR